MASGAERQSDLPLWDHASAEVLARVVFPEPRSSARAPGELGKSLISNYQLPCLKYQLTMLTSDNHWEEYK